MRKFEVFVGMVAVGGLVAFWVPEIWNYGYLQVIGGQVAAAVLGAFLDRFIHS